MRINFPKYNKPLLKRVLELLEGELITTNKTIIGAINELASYLNKITSAGEINLTSLISDITNLQSIVGDGDLSSVFYNGNITQYLIELKQLLDDTNSTTADINNQLGILYREKLDKADPGIEGSDKSIVSNLNALIRKKIVIADINSLLSQNLANGVYEVIVTGNQTVYTLIVELPQFRLIGQNQIGVATSTDTEFTFTNWDYANAEDIQELAETINTIKTDIGDVPLHNKKSIKSSINDLYAKLSYTSNIISNGNFEYFFKWGELPYQGAVITSNIIPGQYRTYADIAKNNDSDPFIGACLILLSQERNFVDLLGPNLPSFIDDIKGVYSFGEDITVDDTLQLALLTMPKEYLQYILNGSNPEYVNHDTTMNINNIYVSSKTTGNEQFVEETKNAIVDIKNKIGRSAIQTGDINIINAINNIFLKFQNYKSEVTTALNTKQNAHNPLLPTESKYIGGAIVEIHNLLKDLNTRFDTLEETIDNINERVSELEVKINNLENPVTEE